MSHARGSLAILTLLVLSFLAPGAHAGYLGVEYRDVNDAEAKALNWSAPRGVKVTRLIAGFPAEKAGILVQDIILTIDGQEVHGKVAEKDAKTPDQLRFAAYVGAKPPGTVVTIRLLRKGQEMQLAATLVEAPAPVRPGPPVCKGKDILSALKGSDAEAYARIQKEAAAIPNAKGLLYRVEREGKAPSYIFGTIHVSDDRVNALSPAINEALASVKRVALEITFGDDTLAALTSLSSLTTYSNDKSLKTDLPPEHYAKLQAILGKLGVPSGATDRTRPWLMMLQLSFPGCEVARQSSGIKPLDQRIGERSIARGVEVVGLETAKSQMEAMARLPEADQIALLSTAIIGHAEIDDTFETLLLRYLDRDVGPIMPLQYYLAEKAGLSREAMQTFERELVVKRNHKMVEAALPFLEEGSLAICVGALHLPGKDGLVELIRAKGYKVTVVE